MALLQGADDAGSRNWLRAFKHHLPLTGRLRRQRDAARREQTRLRALLAAYDGGAPSRIVHDGDLTLLLDRQSLVDRAITDWRDGWERDQLALMIQAARAMAGDARRKVFLDVGAHWGYYALQLRGLGIFDEIHCFEPEPHNFAQLGAQLFLNRASYDIAAHRLAVLDRQQTTWIGRSVDCPENRGHSVVVTATEAGSPVEAVALDEFFDLRGCVLFVKIDVEGCERLVLQGMRRLVADNEVYLQVETFPETESALPGWIPPPLLKRAQMHWDHVYSTFDWRR